MKSTTTGRASARPAAIWEGVVAGSEASVVCARRALLADFSPLGILYSVVAFALDALGIELPTRFSTLGSNMIQGLVNGITAGCRVGERRGGGVWRSRPPAT